MDRVGKERSWKEVSLHSHPAWLQREVIPEWFKTWLQVFLTFNDTRVRIEIQSPQDYMWLLLIISPFRTSLFRSRITNNSRLTFCTPSSWHKDSCIKNMPGFCRVQTHDTTKSWQKTVTKTRTKACTIGMSKFKNLDNKRRSRSYISFSKNSMMVESRHSEHDGREKWHHTDGITPRTRLWDGL